MPIISHGHWESAFPKSRECMWLPPAFTLRLKVPLHPLFTSQFLPVDRSQAQQHLLQSVGGRVHTQLVLPVGDHTGMRLSFPLSSLGPGVAFGEVLFAPSYSWPCPGLSVLLSHWACGEFPLLMLSASSEAIPKTLLWVSSTPAGHMGSPFCSADSSSS